MRSRQEILDERRNLLRANRFLRDDVHRGADAVIAKTAVYVQDALSRHVTTFLGQEPATRGTQPGGELLDLAAAWAFTQREFTELIHKAIDDAPVVDLDHSWSSLSRAELDQKLEVLEDELRKVEREERRRPLLEAQAELDAELAALEG